MEKINRSENQNLKENALVFRKNKVFLLISFCCYSSKVVVLLRLFMTVCKKGVNFTVTEVDEIEALHLSIPLKSGLAFCF